MNVRTYLSTGLYFALFAFLHAGTFKRITIDGSFTDWAGVPPLVMDGADTAPDVVDYLNVYAAHDENYLYLRFTTTKKVNPFTSRENIFIDADGDPATGFKSHVGSEMLIQAGAGYQEKNGGFNEGGIADLGWLAAPADNATNFELRISRKAKFASDNSPVFTSETIQFLLEAETSSFVSAEFAPGAGGAEYTFTPPPPKAIGTTNVVGLISTDWRYDDSGADLKTAWREVSVDDAVWKTGKGLFGLSSEIAAYPAPIKSALAVGRSTYYFRTRFQWDNDMSGIAVLSSNYVSDGAVFYLNGVEIGRLRLTGTITNQSVAIGNATPVGAVEVLSVNPSALVVGENVLAVEIHPDATTPNELVFGMSLLVSDKIPPQITDKTKPANRSAIEGESTTFTVPFIGTEPISFQWLKNGNAIPDATNATYSIATVVADDAGSYQLQLANAVAANVLSRSAVLTTVAVPAGIANDTEPADLTVVEGLTAQFRVTPKGSPPHTFQWLKNGAPIVGATNVALTIDVVQQTDAGNYSVRVGNRLPDVFTSRNAVLTVSRDQTAQTVSSVSGGPNRVVLTFSEPIDPTSGKAIGNYNVTSGVTVKNATLDPVLPSVVILETTGQTLGQVYQVTVSRVKDRFDNVIQPATTRPFLSTILIDGSFEDWNGVAIVISDDEDTDARTDFKDVWVTNDDQFLYLRFTLHTPGDPSTFYNNIFIDTDADKTTGLSIRGIGSELLIQSGEGYQQKNGGFNEGGVEGVEWQASPAGLATDFEVRISLNAKFVGDGSKVFQGTNVVIMLETENTNFITVDTAPDQDGIAYTLLPVSPLPPIAAPIKAMFQANGEVAIHYDGVLQSSSTMLPGSWENVVSASSPFLLRPVDRQKFFRKKP